jgi:hypothetical protein
MTENAWRSGDRMVVRLDAELPDRCVKTDLPAHGQWAEIRLTWHHPALYLVLLVNIIVYFIVAYFVSTSATGRVGITERAVRAARRARLYTWALLLGGSACWAAALAFEVVPLFWVGLAAMIVAIPVYLLGARIVWASRIEGAYIWLEGVNRDYLARLPEWMG